MGETRDLFGRGVSKLSPSRSGGRNVEFGGADVKAFQILAEGTPESRIDRVTGVLDSLTTSTRTFLLKIDEKNVLRGIAGTISLDTLKALLGERLVLEGMVSFRPSGRPQRVEADYAARAKEQDDIWERLPRSDAGLVQSAAGSDLQALFGKWPGSETDGEIFAALEELS